MVTVLPKGWPCSVQRRGSVESCLTLAHRLLQVQHGSAGIRVPDNIFTLNCELCKGGHHEAKIILCDQCDRGCHLFCLNPPLEEVPEGHWVCPLCIEAEAEGGAFRQGEEYSMSEFEQIAGDFQKQYFKDHDITTGPVSLPTF